MAVSDDLLVTVAPVFLPRETRWVIGLDLGQSSDPTAIAVLEHTRGVLDSNTPSNRHCGIEDIKQVRAERIDCRHLQMAPIAVSDSELVCVMALAKNTPPVMRRNASALPKHRAWTQMMEQGDGSPHVAAPSTGFEGTRRLAWSLPVRFSGPWPGQHRTGVADIRLPYRTARRARGTWIGMVLPD